MKKEYKTPDMMVIFFDLEIATGLDIVGGSGSGEDWEAGVAPASVEPW